MKLIERTTTAEYQVKCLKESIEKISDEKFLLQEVVKMRDSAYQSLEARHKKLLEALEYYADKKHWGESGIDQRGWYVTESTDRGAKAREAIEADRKAGGE